MGLRIRQAVQAITWDSGAASCGAARLDRVGAGNEAPPSSRVRSQDATTLGTPDMTTPMQVSTVNTFDERPAWLVADSDPNSPNADNLYLVWQGLAAPTRIMFSIPPTVASNWSAPPAGLPSPGEGFVWPAYTQRSASNGDVYLGYHTDTCGAANAGTIQLLRDGTGGAAFAAGTVPQRSTAFGAGDATVTCNVQGGGSEIPGASFWLQGTMQPWILPDPDPGGPRVRRRQR